MKRIQLFIQGNTWMSYHPDDPMVEEAFGTKIIPTAFLTAMPGEEVRHRIQELNPGSFVELR